MNITISITEIIEYGYDLSLPSGLGLVLLPSGHTCQKWTIILPYYLSYNNNCIYTAVIPIELF